MTLKNFMMFGAVTGLLGLSALPVRANILATPTATATCHGYSLNLNATDLQVGTAYTISYTFTLTCGGGSPITVTNSVTFTATSSAYTNTVTGTFPNPPGTDCLLTGSATLSGGGSSGTPVGMVINGQPIQTPLTCGVSTLTLACPVGSGQVGVPYNSSFVPSGGLAPYSVFYNSGYLPLGLTAQVSGSVSGTPTTAGTYTYSYFVEDASMNTAVANCSATITTSGPPPSTCTTGLHPITYNLSEQSQNVNEVVWFNSHFKLQGTLPTSTFTVFVQNGTIQFGTSTLTVPNGQITFSSTATCASTVFDTILNQWETALPLSAAAKADEIFAAGLVYVLPPNFPQNVHGVTWTADFSSTAPSLSIQWQWGAANYLTGDNKGNVFPMNNGAPDYNAMMIDGAHNVPTCAGFNAGDHAGTPENPAVKALVTGGGSGGGGSNWTGSWSSTQSLVCQ